MDISSYNYLIEFAEKNKQQAVLLGGISDHLFKNYDVSAKIHELDSNGISYFDASTLKFKAPLQAEYFYSLFVLKHEMQEPGFDIIQFITNSDFTELHRTKKISYHFDKLLLVNSSRIFDLDIAKVIVEYPDVPDRINHLFFESSSYHNLTSPFFLNALDRSTKGIKPEHNYITLNIDLRRIGTTYPETAETIISKFKGNPQKSILFFPHIFLGLIERNGFERYISIIEELLFDLNQETRIASIRSITMLHGNKNHLQSFEDKVEAIYFKIINEENITLTAEILNSFGILIKYLPSSVRMILDIPEKYHDSRILFTLSHLLWIHSDTYYNQPWFTESLIRLSSFDNTHRGIFHNLYMTFIGLEKNDPALIYEYFDLYIANEANDPTAIEGFKHTIISRAHKDKDTFEAKLTDWFNSDSHRFHAAAATACSILWVTGLKELRLSKNRLDNFSPYDIEYVLLKVVGNIASKEHLQSLVFSSLKRNMVSAQHYQMVVELFVSYIAYNYPGVVDFLESKRENANSIELRAIDAVKSTLDEYYQNRPAKPKELNPSVDRIKVFFTTRAKKFQQQNTRGRYPDTSIIDFVQKITIKNGHYYFSRVEKSFGFQQYTPKSSMQRMEMNMEMPGGEFTDPTGQAYNRVLWRMFKRRSK